MRFFGALQRERAGDDGLDALLAQSGELAVTALARVPLALPVLLSYTLFRWECNMRAATVLGFVGGPR